MLIGTKIRRWLLVAALLLPVALAGCTGATPSEEVRAGAGGGSAPATSPASAIGPSTTTTPPAGYHPPDGGGSGEPAEPAEPAEPGVVDPPPPGPAGDQPPPVTGDRHPQQWDDYTVAADGRTLTFTYYAGVAPCSVFDSIEADEGPDTVRVTIYEHSGPPGAVCIMLAQQKSATVTLAAPLGDRHVV